ncbi:MAG: hypothetical protein WD295_06000 [Bacteroidota bacterium]
MKSVSAAGPAGLHCLHDPAGIQYSFRLTKPLGGSDSFSKKELRTFGVIAGSRCRRFHAILLCLKVK